MTSWGPREGRILCGLVLVALVMRIGYVALVTADDPLVGDQIYYSAQAVTIADGRWFEEPFIPGEEAADHPPLTALLLAPFSWGSEPWTAQRLLMAVLGAVVVLAVALLARTVAGARAGLLAGLIATVYAPFWMNDGVVMSETISTLAVVLVLLAAYRYRAGPDGRRALLLGALVGLAALARAEVLLVLVLVVAPLMLMRRLGAPDDWPARLRHLAAAGLATVAALLPWAVYNLSRFEKPVLISTNDGLTLVGANCDPTYFGPGIGSWNIDCGLSVPLPDGLDQSERSAELRSVALEYATEHTERWPAVVAARAARVWGVWEIDQGVESGLGEGRLEAASWLGAAQLWVAAPLAVVGAATLRRRGVPLLPLLAMPVLVTIVAISFYGLWRFRIPAEVSIVVLAAVGVERLLAGRPPLPKVPVGEGGETPHEGADGATMRP